MVATVFRRRRGAVALLIGGLVSASGSAVAAGTPDAVDREARMVAGNCLLCHGSAASAAGGVPMLKGQEPVAIATAMRAFRDGERHGTIMPRIAKGYDDAVIDALAAYLAKAEQ